MTDTYKVLAQGQLPAVAGVLYTVPGGTQTIVSRIVLANTDNVNPRTATLYQNGTAATNEILPPTSIDPGARYVDDGRYTMAATNTIQGKADAASEITYTIYGLEIS